jgi:hypothetical protein
MVPTGPDVGARVKVGVRTVNAAAFVSLGTFVVIVTV